MGKVIFAGQYSGGADIGDSIILPAGQAGPSLPTGQLVLNQM